MRPRPAFLAPLLLVAAAAAGAPAPPRVAFLGDSLTAGLGVAESDAFPAVVARLLGEDGLAIRVVDAGVSGDTTAGGLARLDWVLRSDPGVVVVELGANDGLRGLDLARTEASLKRIVERASRGGRTVVLLGMHVPTNYGPEYTREFAAIYPRVASETGALLVPDFLDGVGGVAAMTQPDGLHPNAAGHRRLAKNLLPVLRKAVLGRKRAAPR